MLDSGEFITPSYHNTYSYDVIFDYFSSHFIFFDTRDICIRKYLNIKEGTCKLLVYRVNYVRNSKTSVVFEEIDER